MDINIITISIAIDDALISTLNSLNRCFVDKKRFKVNKIIVLPKDIIAVIPGVHNVVSQDGRGIYNAMNKGLQQALLPGYVMFLNAGDVLQSNVGNFLSDLLDTDRFQESIYRLRCVYKCTDQIVPGSGFNSDYKLFSHQGLIVKYEGSPIYFNENYSFSGDKHWYFKHLFSNRFHIINCDKILSVLDCEGVSRNGKYELKKFIEDVKIDTEFGQLTLIRLTLRTLKTLAKLVLRKFLTREGYNRFLYLIGK